ncbi:MAG: hypothetical protein K0S74_1828 [Chlamydiales bacterium]|jgi:WD40 repeat protein|nr:hypothetical protein [Chlamydiales bacterium]
MQVSPFSYNRYLPKNLLEDTFAYCDGPTLANAARVSKLWNKLANNQELWKILFQKTYQRYADPLVITDDWKGEFAKQYIQEKSMVQKDRNQQFLLTPYVKRATLNDCIGPFMQYNRLRYKLAYRDDFSLDDSLRFRKVYNPQDLEKVLAMAILPGQITTKEFFYDAKGFSLEIISTIENFDSNKKWGLWSEEIPNKFLEIKIGDTALSKLLDSNQIGRNPIFWSISQKFIFAQIFDRVCDSNNSSSDEVNSELYILSRETGDLLWQGNGFPMLDQGIDLIDDCFLHSNGCIIHFKLIDSQLELLTVDVQLDDGSIQLACITDKHLATLHKDQTLKFWDWQKGVLLAKVLAEVDMSDISDCVLRSFQGYIELANTDSSYGNNVTKSSIFNPCSGEIIKQVNTTKNTSVLIENRFRDKNRCSYFVENYPGFVTNNDNPGNNHTVEIYNAVGGHSKILQDAENPIHYLKTFGDHTLFTGSYKGVISIWDSQTFEKKRTIDLSTYNIERINSIDYVKDATIYVEVIHNNNEYSNYVISFNNLGPEFAERGGAPIQVSEVEDSSRSSIEKVKHEQSVLQAQASYIIHEQDIEFSKSLLTDKKKEISSLIEQVKQEQDYLETRRFKGDSQALEKAKNGDPEGILELGLDSVFDLRKMPNQVRKAEKANLPEVLNRVSAMQTDLKQMQEEVEALERAIFAKETGEKGIEL